MLATISIMTLAHVPAAPPPATLQVNSVWDFVVKGGWSMIPIGLCSLVALTVIVERAITLRRNRIVPRQFVSGLKSVAHQSKQALEFCRANGSPIANVLAVGI